MSQHLAKKYLARFRKRKREERLLADDPEGGDSGDASLDGAGPSTASRRSEEREEEIPGRSNAPSSTSAERTRRYRKRKRAERPVFDRSDSGGDTADDRPIGERVRQRRRGRLRRGSVESAVGTGNPPERGEYRLKRCIIFLI